MKKLKALACGVMLGLLSMNAAAQSGQVPLNEPDYNKPRIFTDLPDNMTLRLVDADKLFMLTAGAPVNVLLTDQLSVKGTVISNSESNQVRSIIIRVTNRNDAILTFTRINTGNGSVSYTGRMISRDHGDALEIKKEEMAYFMKKINLYDLISE